MASIESSIIGAIKVALVNDGYTVFDSIDNHHTGRKTKSKTYIELDRSITTDWTEITQETITGPYTFIMRYHQAVSLVKNNNGEMLDFTTNCLLIEKSISQVQTGPMFNRLNIAQDGTATSDLRGLTREFIITGTLAAHQDRREAAVTNLYFVDDALVDQYFVDDAKTEALEVVA